MSEPSDQLGPPSWHGTVVHSTTQNGTPRLPSGLPDYPANPMIDPQHVWIGGPSGTSYLTSSQKRRIKSYCASRDGLKCMYCKQHDESLRFMTVHHVDRNTGNNYSDNLQNLHWDCNIDARYGKVPRRLEAQRVGIEYTHPPKNADAQLATTRDEILADKTVTVSTRLNIEHEFEFRKSCFKAVLDMFDPAVDDPEKFMGRHGLMAYAMEMSGSSSDAAYGYMKKLFAPRVGPLKQEKEGKVHTVKFRHPGDMKLGLDDLMAKYPKEGQSFRAPEEGLDSRRPEESKP